jgi:mRNA interferase RelE/StbE
VAYVVRYHPGVADHDIKRLAPGVRARIARSIAERLTLAPARFGAPLSGSLRGYWKLRVGDYRVVYKVDAQTVFVLAIVHRREAYERAARRAGP